MPHTRRHVVAVYSPKGGVGKTTLAMDMAWRSAALGNARTLLWDLDAQGGAAYLLDLKSRESGNVAGVFQKEGRPEQLVMPTRYDRLDVLCADDSLRTLSWQLARLGRRQRLAEITGRFKRQYQRIILDCPALQNEVSYQVLLAADVVVVPLPPSPLAARALDLMMRDLRSLTTRHPPILPVLSMFDGRRREHQNARNGHMADYPVVPMSAEIERIAFRRAPIGTFAANSPAAQALDRVWRGVERKLRECPSLAQDDAAPPVPGDMAKPARLAGWFRPG
ncbi:ParA family protein [Novosphingobium sp.]|uniref:ParA family protein n=1 Tax=Novosphingobium sp. TaxID=1874826 RepID=UPI003341D071